MESSSGTFPYPRVVFFSAPGLRLGTRCGGRGPAGLPPGALKGSRGHPCPSLAPFTKVRSQPRLRAEPRPCVRDLQLPLELQDSLEWRMGAGPTTAIARTGKCLQVSTPHPLKCSLCLGPLQREDVEDRQAERGKAKEASGTRPGPGRESLAEARRVESWVSGRVQSHLIEKKDFQKLCHVL